MTNPIATVTFDAASFQDATRLAGNAFRNADNKGTDYAQAAIAALMLGQLSPMAIANGLYDEMKPLTAKGKLAEPTENDKGVVSVSSLRNAKGGENARSVFNKIVFVSDAVGNVSPAIDSAITAFVMGNKVELNTLVNSIKAAKREIAKALSDSLPKSAIDSEGESETDNDSEAETVNQIAAFATYLDGLDIAAIDAPMQVGLASIMGKIAALSDAIADNAKQTANG